MNSNKTQRELRSRKEVINKMSIESSLKAISEQLETINKKLNKAENRDKEYSQRIQKIEDNVKELLELKRELNVVKSENIYLKERIKNMEHQTKIMRARKLKKSIEIHGIPAIEYANLKDAIIKLADSANVKISEDEITECFIPKSRGNRQKPVIVKFASLEKKNMILRALKIKKPSLGDIGKKPESKKVYINDVQLPEIKRLLFKTKEQLVLNGWKKAWIYANDVYIQRSEKEPNIKIESEEELLALIK